MQILIYPMLDDRNIQDDKHIAPYALWSGDDNQTAWAAALGKERRGGADVKPVEAAARATVEDAEGLPPAYIDVGQLDHFADEDIAYARLLGKAGVDCEFHLIPHVTHGFEVLIPKDEVTTHVMGMRIKAITSI